MSPASIAQQLGVSEKVAAKYSAGVKATAPIKPTPKPGERPWVS